MALRRCRWCGAGLGMAPEATGICPVCTVRLEAESALAHAIVGLRAITDELERARAGIWPPQRKEG